MPFVGLAQPREQALAQGENGTDSGTVGGERQTRTQTTDVIEMRPSSTGNGGGGLGSGGGGGRGAGDGGGDDGAMGKDGPDTTREKGVAMVSAALCPIGALLSATPVYLY